MTLNEWIVVLEAHRAQGRGESKVFVVNDEGIRCNPDTVYIDEDGDLILTDDPYYKGYRN